MRRALHHALIGLLLVCTALVARPMAAQAADASTTFVTMTSERGDFVGGGGSYLWRPGSATVTVDGSVNRIVTVGVSGGASGEDFSFTFAAPEGTALTTGSYTDAQRTTFRTAGHPGIDISGDGRGCNETTGRFTVLDVSPDLSRLWLVYEQHCEGGGAATFGEIRYHEPGGDPDLLVAPDHVAWPTYYPGQAARPVPVSVVNTGTSAVTFGDADISQPAEDFRVESNGCTGSLAAGDKCVVYVGFTPSTAGRRTGTLTLSDSSSQGPQTVSLSGDGRPGHTSWSMRSQSGDYIGAGEDWSYSPTTASIGAGGGDSYVHVSVGSGDDYWEAEFNADSGHLLLPGQTFTAASRYPFNDSSSPGLEISGDGRGCNELWGRFTVHQATYDDGRLTSFSVTFEQHCEGKDSALLGSIAWQAADPAEPVPAPDTTPTSPITDFHPRDTESGPALVWANPGDGDWKDTVVRRAAGRTAPRDIRSGTLTYTGRGHQSSPGETLSPGRDYSYSVFSQDYSGNASQPQSLTLSGTRLSAAASASHVAAGDATTIHGHLVDGDSGEGLTGQQIALYQRRRHTSGLHFVQTLVTDRAGAYAVDRTLSSSMEYFLRYTGDAHRLPTRNAKAVVVLVSPRVSLHSSRSSTHRGEAVALATVVTPSHRGLQVELQRRFQGAWRRVTEARLSSRGRAVFHVRPTRAGRYSYRVVRRADDYRAAGTSRTVRLRVS